MNVALRATVMTVLALVCLDGHAKSGCVSTLEAKPTRIETPAPMPRPCPTAVGYLQHPSSSLRVAGTPGGASRAMRHA